MIGAGHCFGIALTHPKGRAAKWHHVVAGFGAIGSGLPAAICVAAQPGRFAAPGPRRSPDPLVFCREAVAAIANVDLNENGGPNPDAEKNPRSGRPAHGG